MPWASPRGQADGEPNFRGRDAIHEFNTLRLFSHGQQFPTNLRVLRLRVPCGNHVANILFVFLQGPSGHTNLFLSGVPEGFPNQNVYRAACELDFKTHRWPQGSLSD